MFRFMMTCYSSMMRALKCTTLPLVALQIHIKKKIEAIFVHLPVSPQNCWVLSTRGVILLRISRPFLTGLFSLDSHVTAQYLALRDTFKTNCLKWVWVPGLCDTSKTQHSSPPSVPPHTSLSLYCSHVVQLVLLVWDKQIICMKDKHLMWFLFVSSCKKNQQVPKRGKL